MMYALQKTYKGKTEIIMVDTYAKVNSRKRVLEQSQRKGIKGNRVDYLVVEADEEADKKKFKPVGYHDGAGRSGPRRIRK
jgi:hypothetical protein